MFVAWMTTVSIGVIIARFFKPVWSKVLFGESAWFQVGGRKNLMQFLHYLNTPTWKHIKYVGFFPFFVVIVVILES